LLSTPLGREYYDGDWVYFCLNSLTGCTVHMNVLFKDEVVNDVKKKVEKIIDLNAGKE
jgi:hypothetical protein